MKSLFATVFSLSIAAFVPPALAQPAGDTARQPSGSAPRADAADHQFLTRASDDNRLQTELGKLAKEKGGNQLVKDFGQRMIDDHTLAQNELERIAAERGLAVPTQNEPAQSAAYKQLSQLSGQAFDSAYLQHMEKEHTEAIRDFQSEARRGSDPQLKQYAERQVPMLRSHEEIARVVQRQSKEIGRQPSTQHPPGQGAPGQGAPGQEQQQTAPGGMP